ncbi:pyridoxal phosphate-dependent aminotransferase [Alisedimentitalea sp. MJ-SS2]|uniref:pyridoxal phosphate-dependent aminotransferase n=1 Tax=Aliisedimentitalea sp. MJ-SS2 TaxID=3049795 RepID=UPI00290DD09B|nr:pyridoxal phosphate-dependent aminotransferase [Alisedimentitalea sp. MJ-SS2]MDU8926649.1 pyridoxal phosphate-dependent aminotransferase [Alisedimentitalea sp. MJ-SS2]
MSLSNRITTLTPDASGGWELFFRARAMIDAGEQVTELTIGEHDIRTDTRILDEMHRAARAGHTGYAAIPGIAPLREEIAARVQAATGVPTTLDNVVVTAGGQAALFAAHVATCDSGDRALFIDPYYATYPGTLRGASATPVPVKASPDSAFQPDPADIDAAAADGAASLLINSPNNPTGVVYSRTTLEGIAEVAQNSDFWVISDEVYDTQVWQGDHLSIRALPGMAERTLVVGSMSKSHAMTGSRIGWIVGPKEAIAHITNLSTHTNYGVAGFVQDAALYALRQGPGFEEEIAAPFRRRREIALDILAGQNVVRAVPPQGAMYLMLDIRATGLSGNAFAEKLLDTHRIAVMPGESFGKAASGHIRVAMTIGDDAFAAALKSLVAFAAAQI